MVYFAYKYPEVVHHNTYISYDLLTLIGEVGGLLGLTLGASGLSIIMSVIEKCLTRLAKKNKKNKEPQMEWNQKSVSGRFSDYRMHNAHNIVRPQKVTPEVE